MTDRIEWFTEFQRITLGKWPVMIVDNCRLWVCGIGSIKIRCFVDGRWEPRTMARVLYVPKLRKNLFLVGQAADRGFVSTYTSRTCYLTSNEGQGKIVLNGVRCRKLYELHLMVEKPTS
jgi:hypothetical protein